jgi:cytochrome c
MRQRCLPQLLVLVLLGVTLLASSRPAQADDDELGGIPRAPGAEETYYLCSACHSFRLVAQQGLSYESWKETLVWMIEEQEMPTPEPGEFELIARYLAKFYGRDRLARKLAKQP